MQGRGARGRRKKWRGAIAASLQSGVKECVCESVGRAGGCGPEDTPPGLGGHAALAVPPAGGPGGVHARPQGSAAAPALSAVLRVGGTSRALARWAAGPGPGMRRPAGRPGPGVGLGDGVVGHGTA